MKSTRLDGIFIGIIFILLFTAQSMIIKESNKRLLWVLIKTPTQTIRTELSKDNVFYLQGPLGEAKVVIQNSQVFCEHAPCVQQICVKTGKITREHENIICIPNKMIVTIVGQDNEDYDGITK